MQKQVQEMMILAAKLQKCTTEKIDVSSGEVTRGLKSQEWAKGQGRELVLDSCS